MERWNFASGICALITFSMILFSGGYVNALPPASGSKCNSNWVNNNAAMNCFIQGEDETHAGAAHPHYVACTSAGEVFCCVDDNKGNQNCEVCAAGAKGPTDAAKLNALLNGQMIMLSNMNKLSTRVGSLETKVGGMNRSASAPGAGAGVLSGGPVTE